MSLVMRTFARVGLPWVVAGAIAAQAPSADPAVLYPSPQPKAEGYRGIWYFNQPSNDRYRYKYSGGFATYPQQQGPIAYHSPEANKTFFCYGGTVKGKRELLHMVSYFDHVTGKLARPTILLNKKTSDAHDNPVMTVDDRGYIWIFSNSHGTSRESYIHRSARPYSIDDFERVLTTNFSYGHAWHVPRLGFLFLHTKYMAKGRSLFWMASRQGDNWSKPSLLARFALGHYQITGQLGSRVATAFNYHPLPVGLNARTNLYYLETSDLGKTWTTVDGKPVSAPVEAEPAVALVHDYESEGLLVYLKTVEFDTEGRPVILYLTSKGYASGPENGPRIWCTARWTGKRWEIRRVTESDHNYDFGSLYIEPEGTWRLIAPTDPGPQPHGTGGEMVMWLSEDQGRNWRGLHTLTPNSSRNHTYARRPVNAHPDFYALWADGNAWEPSESSLYFTDRDGTTVWRMPKAMTADLASPEVAW